MNIQDIIKGAKRFHACEIADSIFSVDDAINMFLSPQGREFAMNTGYPRIEDLRVSSELWKDNHRVFLDTGDSISNSTDALAIGNTNLTINADNPNKLYHIMAMHGAKVTIKASGYAVVTATNIGGRIEVINDGSASIDIEEKK